MGSHHYLNCYSPYVWGSESSDHVGEETNTFGSSFASSSSGTTALPITEPQRLPCRQRRSRRIQNSTTPARRLTPPTANDGSISYGPLQSSSPVARPFSASSKGKGKADSGGQLTPGRSDDEPSDEDEYEEDWMSEDGESGGVSVGPAEINEDRMDDCTPSQEPANHGSSGYPRNNSYTLPPVPQNGLLHNNLTASASTFGSNPLSFPVPASMYDLQNFASAGNSNAPTTWHPSSQFQSQFPNPNISADFMPGPPNSGNAPEYGHQHSAPTMSVGLSGGFADQLLSPSDPFDYTSLLIEAIAAPAPPGHGTQEAPLAHGPSAAQIAHWMEAMASDDMLSLNALTQFVDMDVNEDDFIMEHYHCDDSFSKFLQRWTMVQAANPRSHSDLDILEPGALKSVDAHRRGTTTVKDLQGDFCDLQGINWARLGTTRAMARKARSKLYRNRTNLPCAKQSPEAQFLPSTERYFAFRGSSASHRISVPHFQLRNLLSATSRTDVYTVSKSKIMHTDPSSSAVRCIVDFSRHSTSRGLFKASTTSITCMTATDRVIAVGGFEGEYALVDAASAPDSEPTVGQLTYAQNGSTNHVNAYLGRTNGVVQAAFCSNDNRVRILDCHTNKITAEFEFKDPINCSATSPNGRLSVLVGDSTDSFITNAETGAILQTLRQNDFGFACAWADDGIHVATGAQDLQTVIYDARWWTRPLQIIASELACPRSLHFSPVGSGHRVLVAAEQADVVNVIDAVTFRKKQTLDFFGGIAGCSFTPDGGEFFVANHDRVLGGMLAFERIGYGEKYWVDDGGYDGWGSEGPKGHDWGSEDAKGHDWGWEEDVEWDGRSRAPSGSRRLRGLGLDDVVV